MRILSLTIVLLSPLLASAQLVVTVSAPKVTGNKAVVPLAMKNNFAQKVESARAAVFLLDDQGKMVCQATRWVLGGSQDKPGLAAGATNVFNFVITNEKRFSTTNLTSKVSFIRVILEDGKLADPAKEVTIQPNPTNK